MIVIFDIGKTNKKCFVFDEDYRIVYEKSVHLPETADEDGEPCEDLYLLKNWIWDSLLEILKDWRLSISAVNFTTYGASLVYLDTQEEPCLPLYNYLKPYPAHLESQFFTTYGGMEKMSLETASPVLGSLNSGLQMYRIKHLKPEAWITVKHALHLPQFVASLISGAYYSDITSIGCHTMLWNFEQNRYHEWTKKEGVVLKLPPIRESDSTAQIPLQVSGRRHNIEVGVGLHDSSSALIPYLASFEEPFVLISTGTWNITLHPFNDTPLTPSELAQDCLCYLSYEGKPVKASRLFAGNLHEQGVQKIAADFGVAGDFYQSSQLVETPGLLDKYRELVQQLVEKQVISTNLVLRESPVRRIFVDGGFSRNEIFMQMLAASFPELEVFAAEVPQATALGAALAIHRQWNSKPVPKHLIRLNPY